MFNNKKSRQALAVIITALAVITIFFNNKLTVSASEVVIEETKESTKEQEEFSSTLESVTSKASTMRYSPVLYKIATNDDGLGFFASGNNQLLIYNNGEYLCPNGNFIWQYDSVYGSEKYSFKNDMIFNEYNQLYFNNSGSVYVGLGTLGYSNFSNCYFISDSITENDALDIVAQNLGTASIQNQYNIQDLYITEDFGQDKMITEYIAYDLDQGKITFLSADNLGFYIDYLQISGSDYSQPYFYRQYFYSLDSQTLTFTQLENIISEKDCSTNEDDILLLGIGSFTYSGEVLTSNMCVSLNNRTVNSWSYRSFVYTKYNTKDAFLEEPSSSNTNLKVEYSNVINATTDPSSIDNESEDIRSENFFEAVLGALNNSFLGQIVGIIKDLSLEFANSFVTMSEVFSAVLGWLPDPLPSIIIGVFMFVFAACVVRVFIALISHIK